MTKALLHGSHLQFIASAQVNLVRLDIGFTLKLLFMIQITPKRSLGVL